MSGGPITSVQNQRVKDARKLRSARQRGRQARFPIDGAREIVRALDFGVPLVEAFVCEPLCKSAEGRRALERLRASGVTLWQVTPEVFEKLAFGQRDEGIVAIARHTPCSLDRLEIEPAALVAVLDGLEKPGNVGAVLRSADGAGVGGVIVCGGRTDLFNPNCIRASLGTVFGPRVCVAETHSAIEWLAARSYRIYAARPDAELVYTDADFRGPSAIVLGSEAAGLGKAWQTQQVVPIKLPMHGMADSLNVSVAAAVLFYEALRQRG